MDPSRLERRLFILKQVPVWKIHCLHMHVTSTYFYRIFSYIYHKEYYSMYCKQRA